MWRRKYQVPFPESILPLETLLELFFVFGTNFSLRPCLDVVPLGYHRKRAWPRAQPRSLADMPGGARSLQRVQAIWHRNPNSRRPLARPLLVKFVHSHPVDWGSSSFPRAPGLRCRPLFPSSRLPALCLLPPRMSPQVRARALSRFNDEIPTDASINFLDEPIQFGLPRGEGDTMPKVVAKRR